MLLIIGILQAILVDTKDVAKTKISLTVIVLASMLAVKAVWHRAMLCSCLILWCLLSPSYENIVLTKVCSRDEGSDIGDSGNLISVFVDLTIVVRSFSSRRFII